ncbi:MAG: hypothetical protein ABR575_01820 [Actinomycetota bacterium]
MHGAPGPHAGRSDGYPSDEAERLHESDTWGFSVTMGGSALVDLEAAIKATPGVLGCVILTDPDGSPSEIQAFTRVGIDGEEIRTAILQQAEVKGVSAHLENVFVFELEAESHFGDRETLDRAAELAEQEARTRGTSAPRAVAASAGVSDRDDAPSVTSRPPLQKVALSSSTSTSEARVALGGGDREVVGQASGAKTTHGLAVLADATLSAVNQMVDAGFRLAGASLVDLVGHQVVLVVVNEDGGPDMVGSALVRGGPVTEAAVRATLNAVNRRVEMIAERR